MAEFLETTVDKFIFKVATDRLYGSEGVWLLDEGDRVRIGVTDYQQQLNGDVAFVHLKPVGTSLAVGDEFVEVETIKATVSLRFPIAATILEVNTDLDLTPEAVNQDPYGKGWLAVVKPANWQAERGKLLGPDAYLSAIRSQAQEELSQ